MSKLALVLSAGGARGAYEAGVVHYLRTALPKAQAHQHFDIYSGTSVGAINTVGLAATAHEPALQGERLKSMWFQLRQGDIYRRDLTATTHFLGSTVGGIMRNFLTFNPFHIPKRGPHFESFLDTRPLKQYLAKNIPWAQLEKNIKKGPIDAVVINVTNLTNGRNELFLSKKKGVPYRGNYICHLQSIKVEHVMASAAIPIIFPPEKIGRSYYADGGLRLFTPMSPAIQLGADRLIVIGLRKRTAPNSPYLGRSRNDVSTPTIPEQLGRLLNGLFLDRIEFDMEQLERINTIVDTSEKIFGKDYLERINKKMKKNGSQLDIAQRGLRKIKAIEIQPSEFINKIFLEWFNRDEKSFKFSGLEKMLVRVLDIDPATGSDLLSYLIFAPRYIRDLFELGYQDAQKQRDEILEVLAT